MMYYILLDMFPYIQKCAFTDSKGKYVMYIGISSIQCLDEISHSYFCDLSKQVMHFTDDYRKYFHKKIKYFSVTMYTQASLHPSVNLNKNKLRFLHFFKEIVTISEVYLNPCQSSMMNLSAKLVNRLTHFSPVSHIYTPKGFLTFSGCLEM